jgi:dTDP-glucose 4,6-dehydratase
VRNVLVTGGAGFIGGNFVSHWLTRFPSDRVVVLDALTYAGNLETLAGLNGAGRFRFVHGDICDRDLVKSILHEESIDTLINFAAESHVDRSIVDSAAFVRTNVVGTHVLLDAVRAVWCPHGAWSSGVRFHHVSTDEVYGSLGPADPPFTEDSPYTPNSPYAASKAASDHLVRAYVHTYGLPATISNCSNNYGPYQFPEKLVSLMIVNCLLGRRLPVYGDGRQVRDWLHVLDHCEAIERIVLTAEPGSCFNVGGRAERQNIDIVRKICREIDRRFMSTLDLQERFPDCPATSGGTSCEELITPVRDRPGHDRRYAIDPTRISVVLGFEPSRTLDVGVMQTVDWYISNESWWRAVMDGSYRKWVDLQYGELR